MSGGPEDVRQVVTFRLGKEAFAVPIAQVQEIIRPTAITAVPRAASHVDGVVNLRGRIVPVIDLARLLGLAGGEPDAAGRIVITAVGGLTVGMRVDAVNEVARLALDAIEPPPDAILAGDRNAFITGIGRLGDRLLILLDLPRVLSARQAAEAGAALATTEEAAG